MSVSFENGFTGFERRFRQALAALGASRLLARVDVTVKERTRRGEFLEGSSPGAEQYSTRPFARPAAGLKKRTLEALDDTAHGSTYFTKNGKLWVVVHGGYRMLRELEGKQTGHVDLLYSGAVLDGTRGASEIAGDVLSFEYGYLDGKSPDDAARIARYQQVEGVGPSRKKRVFIGLSGTEEEAMRGFAERELMKALG